MSLHDPVERLDSCHLIVEAGDAAAYERQEIHGNEGFSVRVSGHGNAGINKRNGCFEKHIGFGHPPFLGIIEGTNLPQSHVVW